MKSFCREEFGAFVHWASRALSGEDFGSIPSWAAVKDWPGRIVGACDYAARGRNGLVLEAVTSRLSNAWDEGYPYWWDLSEVICF